jgi:hypothetical protein
MTTYKNNNANDYNEIINEDTINYLNDIYLRSNTYKKKKDENFYKKLKTSSNTPIFDVLFRNKDIYENISDKWKKARKDYKEKTKKLIDINDKNITGFIKKIALHLDRNFDDIYELIKYQKFVYKNTNIKNRKELFERIYECVKYVFWVLQITENDLVSREFFNYKVQSLDGIHTLHYNLFTKICENVNHFSSYITRLNYFFDRITSKYKNDTFEVCRYTMKELKNLFNRVIVEEERYDDNVYAFSGNLFPNDYHRIMNIIGTKEEKYHIHYQQWVHHFGLSFDLTTLNVRLMVQNYYIDSLKKWKIFINKRKYIYIPSDLTEENTNHCYYLNTYLLFINNHSPRLFKNIMNYNLEDYEKSN